MKGNIYSAEIKRLVGRNYELVDFISSGDASKAVDATTKRDSKAFTSIMESVSAFLLRLKQTVLHRPSNTVCFTNVPPKQPIACVPVSSLLFDEIDARVYQIGVFSVRMAKVACKEYPQEWRNRKQLSKEQIQELRLMKQFYDSGGQNKEIKQQLSELRARRKHKLNETSTDRDIASCDFDCRIETVVSACKHKGLADARKYKYICHAQEDWHGWCEHISWIGAVRIKSNTKPNVLIVKKDFHGDSRSGDSWYRYPSHSQET